MAAPPTAVMPFSVVVAKRGILPAAKAFAPPIVNYRHVSSTIDRDVSFAINGDVSIPVNR
jgi:hypothetical protein